MESSSLISSSSVEFSRRRTSLASDLIVEKRISASISQNESLHHNNLINNRLSSFHHAHSNNDCDSIINSNIYSYSYSYSYRNSRRRRTCGSGNTSASALASAWTSSLLVLQLICLTCCNLTTNTVAFTHHSYSYSHSYSHSPSFTFSHRLSSSAAIASATPATTRTTTSRTATILQVANSQRRLTTNNTSSPPSSTSSSSNPPPITSFYEHEKLVAPPPSYSINVEAQSSSQKMNTKIAHLLSDDDGEEDDDLPDYSEEAANEIADKSSYSRISEEAKYKANVAMQKNLYDDGDEDSSVDANDHLSVTKAAAAAHTQNPRRISIVATNVPREGNFQNKNSKLHKQTQQQRLRKTQGKVRASITESGEDTIRQYVKSMGSHELLPKESEVLLGRQIQILVKWETVRSDLEETLASPPTFAQWSEALGVTVPELKKQIRKSQRAKAALTEANLRLVVTVARSTVKKARTEINFQDACQEGILGLSRACEKFDPEKGFRFSTYAIWWIKREVRKNLLEQSRSVRLPASAIKKINDIRINERLLITTLGRKPTNDEIAQKCNMTVEKVLFYKRKALDATSLDKQLSGKAGKGSNASGIDANGKTIGSLVKDDSPLPSQIANKEMFQNDVRRLIKTLSPREQAVIRLRFGLDDGVPKTLDSIGKKFSVETDRIRKIEAKALLKLRQPYRNQSVKCYMSDV